MADKYFYCEFGAGIKSDVSKAGVSTPAADVELRVTYDATNNSKLALLNALEAIEQKIIDDTWPPA